ncbi:MAG TPA: YHS domain-containing protein, partial [Solirubrobacteraceae bacterium]|nr:YHS domain-containing protein [Solirubrobacteraceae bacterium]
FVCSVGNVPLAAVLWSGGISFAGVMAFIFADLIVLPIIAIYRKYYGTRFATRIVLLMFVTMVLAALVIDVLFSALGLVPGGARPGRTDIFSAITLNYKLVLNAVGLIVFAALFWLTARRGATDPVCGMKVDRAKAETVRVDGETHYFCSEHCLHAFQADPARYLGGGSGGGGHSHGEGCHPHTHGAPESGPATATDPICGMTVETGHALSAHHDGQTFYFCSAGCRERFLSDPPRTAVVQCSPDA